MGAFCVEHIQGPIKSIYVTPEVKPINSAILFCHSCSEDYNYILQMFTVPVFMYLQLDSILSL